MHLSKNDIPVLLDSPGAVARQLPGFGEPGGTFGVEYFSLAAGTDLAPLLVGLQDDACHSDHWGYLVSGRVVVTYLDDSTEHILGGEVFYWPAGHSVRVEEDAEVVMFSPQDLHGPVLAHIGARIAAMA